MDRTVKLNSVEGEHTLGNRSGPGATADGRCRRTGPRRRATVAGYELVRMLGRGGMGVVWLAVERRFDRMVALKVHGSAANEAEVAQLWSEAHLAAKIGDSGIVRVHDVGYTLEGHPYYAMDFVEGTDLAALIADQAITSQRAVSIAADIAKAAGAAHAHGVVHRDLKLGT